MRKLICILIKEQYIDIALRYPTYYTTFAYFEFIIYINIINIQLNFFLTETYSAMQKKGINRNTWDKTTFIFNAIFSNIFELIKNVRREALFKNVDVLFYIIIWYLSWIHRYHFHDLNFFFLFCSFKSHRLVCISDKLLKFFLFCCSIYIYIYIYKYKKRIFFASKSDVNEKNWISFT